QLTPDVLAGQNAQQKFLLLQVGAVRENGGGGQGADPDLGDADGSDALELLLDHRHQADWKVAAVPARRPMRDTPPGFGEFETPFDQPAIRAPVCFEPGASFGADGSFVDRGHAVRLKRSSSAASVRGDRRRRPETPRSFSPA